MSTWWLIDRLLSVSPFYVYSKCFTALAAFNHSYSHSHTDATLGVGRLIRSFLIKSISDISTLSASHTLTHWMEEPSRSSMGFSILPDHVFTSRQCFVSQLVPANRPVLQNCYGWSWRWELGFTCSIPVFSALGHNHLWGELQRIWGFTIFLRPKSKK